jgi:hypothetical protein
MSRFEGPQGIVTNGLVLNLDAGDPDSYTRSQPPYVEVLVVAGGASGGSSTPSNGGGGGGGAGGVIYNSAYQLASAAAVTVTVGAGGAGQTTNDSQGNNGSNSVFGSLTAVGGGGGGGAGVNTTGRNGGSGGGAGYAGYYNNFNSGTGTAGQGFRGGYVLANNNAGGGGGAGGVGGDTFDSRPEPGYPAGNGGLGGPGVYYSISGTSTLYSNGGNGGSQNQNTIVSGSGTTGAYGGSGATSTAGSGIVIVRYPGLPAATGGTITYLNGYTIHTFTSSGTFTPYLWNDISGNNNSGSLINGVGFNSYQNGGSLIFDGTDDYVNVGCASNTIRAYNSSTEFVIKLPLYSGGQRCILSYRSAGTMYIGKNSGGIFVFYDTLNIQGYVVGSITNGSIAHCVVICDATNNLLSVYINGTLAGSVSRTGWSTTYNTTLDLGFDPGTNEYMVGNMYLFRHYNRTLSSTEVTQNYNATKARFGL